MKQPQSVTDLPEAPEDEHRRRVFQYVLAMSIRVACVIACIWVRGWWLLIPAAGAIFLPYVAVVLANVGSRRRSSVVRPGETTVAIDAPRGPVLELPAAIGPAADDEPRP
jgi:hypothetical protein